MNYTLSIFRDVSQAWVADSVTLDLDGLASVLTEFTRCDRKTDSLLFNLAQFRTLEEGAECGRKYDYVDGVRQESWTPIANVVRRCKSNVVSITGLVLDVDAQHSLEDMVQLMDGVYCIFYTTFRHTWEHNKFRVVVPFSRPLLAQDIPGRERSICSTFPGVDHASFTASQSFYFHSGPDAHNALSFVMDGQLIDPYSFEEEIIQPYTPQPYVEAQQPSDRYVARVLKSLNTCSNVHYDSQQGAKNGGVLTLVTICRSIGLSYQQFDELCARICAHDSQLTKREVRRAVWTGWNGDRITKDKRDAYIVANGGTIPDNIVMDGFLEPREAVRMTKQRVKVY